MPISLPDIVRITNAEQSGIVLATEVSGARCVATLDDLYAIADPILSPSKNNTNNDALGQEWYVVSENASYKLVDWNNRKSSAGWESIISAATWSSVVATGKNEEVGIIPAGGSRQLVSSGGNNIASFKEDNVQLSYVNGTDVNSLDISDQGLILQSTNGSKTYSFRVYDDGITIRGRYIDFYNQAGKLTFPLQNYTSNIGNLGEVTVFQFGSTTKKTAITMVSDRYMGFAVPRNSTGEERYIALHTGESATGDLRELYIGDRYIKFSGAPVQGEDAVNDNHFITKRQLNSRTNGYVATNPELVVANGEANWEVNHNLGTQDVIVQVVEVATNRVAYVGITLNSVNLVTISLTSDVNIPSGTYKVIVK